MYRSDVFSNGLCAPMAREKVTISGPEFVTFFRAPPGYFTGQFIAFSSIPGNLVTGGIGLY